jgi:hypothetical protein
MPPKTPLAKLLTLPKTLLVLLVPPLAPPKTLLVLLAPPLVPLAPLPMPPKMQ